MKKIGLIVVLFVVLIGCATVPTGYSPISSSDTEMIFTRYDEFKGVTFYRHKAFFGSTPVEIYIVKSGSTYSRITFEYKGSDWIFFETATLVNSKGERVSFSFKSYDKTTDVYSGGNVREYIDIKLSESNANKILNLINSNVGELKLRLSGKYLKDYSLSETVLKGLQEMIEEVNNM